MVTAGMWCTYVPLRFSTDRLRQWQATLQHLHQGWPAAENRGTGALPYAQHEHNPWLVPPALLVAIAHNCVQHRVKGLRLVHLCSMKIDGGVAQ